MAKKSASKKGVNPFAAYQAAKKSGKKNPDKGMETKEMKKGKKC